MARASILAGPGLIACSLSCLPPAAIETPMEPALAPATPGETAKRQCRALITERGDRGPRTHELRWDGAKLRSITDQPGLVVGTSDELFALRAERGPFDPVGLYGEPGRGLQCEQDVVWARRLPEGVSQPLAEAPPACVGEFEGERVELQSSLRLLSAVGPLLAWRTATEGLDPSPIGYLDYVSVDLRTAELARPGAWFTAPSETMILPEPERSGCEANDAPRRLAEARGFALVWDEVEGLRVRVGYGCCSWAHNHSMCELDDPLPAPDVELAPMLPDEDRLLRSPFGCGSIGLDGSVRTREGAPVGEHPVSTDALLGVVFLPNDHPFELAWLAQGD